MIMGLFLRITSSQIWFSSSLEQFDASHRSKKVMISEAIFKLMSPPIRSTLQTGKPRLNTDWTPGL